jgi:CheY-like chemotaxis protein
VTALPAATSAHARLKFAIEDTGIGISPADQERLFSPFTQADGSIARRFGGTGLGLVLSQRLVAMMGGALTVESELGRGSTMHFEVELPVGARRDLSRELLPIRGLRALVVDDVESSRHVLVEMLASWSVEAVEASSGAEAIALLLPSKTAPQRPFDLVLLDWRMPTMGGLEVVRWIRDRLEEKVLREPPVVVMVTAFDREQLLDEAAGLPLQAVLRKPVSASRTTSAFRELCCCTSSPTCTCSTAPWGCLSFLNQNTWCRCWTATAASCPPNPASSFTLVPTTASTRCCSAACCPRATSTR